MKKILTVITTVALLTSLASLTACSNAEGTPTGSGSGSVSQNPETNSSGSADSDNSDGNSDNESSEPEPEQPGWHRSDEEGFKEMIDIFTMDDIEAPDGEILKKADADYLYGNKESVVCAGYDFSYLRKVKPYFRNTIDEPGMINWDTLEVSGEPEMGLVPSSEFFKIKAGDVLENGLTVKTAQTAFGYAGDGLLSDMKIELDGEITVEGVLKCLPEDDYILGKGELLFFPDSVKQTDILNPYKENHIEPCTEVDPQSKFALSCNGLYISFGMVDNAPSGVSDLFTDDTYIKAKVTLTDILFRTAPGGVRGFATVKSVEKLG